MLIDKKVVRWNAIIFGILGLLSLLFGLPGLGAMAILFSGVDILAALIYFARSENKKAKSCLLIGGCLLLAGFTLCSSFTLDFK